MKNYGSKIKYNTDWTPITMEVSINLAEAVKKKFSSDYRLPIVEEEWGTDKSDCFVFTFDKSVDKETFLRHLFTMTPEQYEALQ